MIKVTINNDEIIELETNDFWLYVRKGSGEIFHATLTVDKIDTLISMLKLIKVEYT